MTTPGCKSSRVYGSTDVVETGYILYRESHREDVQNPLSQFSRPRSQTVPVRQQEAKLSQAAWSLRASAAENYDKHSTVRVIWYEHENVTVRVLELTNGKGGAAS